LAPVDQVLVISSSGYARLRLPIVGLKAGEFRSIRHGMEKEKRITGVIIDQDGAPLPHQNIWLKKKESHVGELYSFQEDNSIFASARANGQGVFIINELPEGEYWIGPAPVRSSTALELNGKAAPATMVIEISENTTETDCVLHAYKGLFIQGCVMNPAGIRMEETQVEGLSGTGFYSSAKCDDKGNFTLGPLVPGSYKISSVNEKRNVYHRPANTVTAYPGDNQVVLIVRGCSYLSREDD